MNNEVRNAAYTQAENHPHPVSNTTPPDTGLVCLVLLARLHGLAADADQLAHEHGVAGQPLSKTQLLLAAKALGLHAKAVKIKPERLATTPLPLTSLRFFINQQPEHKTQHFHGNQFHGCPR